jgi:large subunit ribosomal protein L9
MSKIIELLLLRNVENTGIVGDVVKVRAGFARNYLLPHALAEHPTPEKIEALKDARAKAQAELAALRARREDTVGKLVDRKITLVRSCNDQGLLYGSITQRDISDALVAEGFEVDMRAVRLAQPFRRIGSYSCLIQFERDLKAEISIEVKADRVLESMMARTEEPEAAPEPAAEASGEGEPDAKPAAKSEGKGEGKPTRKAAKA